MLIENARQEKNKRIPKEEVMKKLSFKKLLLSKKLLRLKLNEKKTSGFIDGIRLNFKLHKSFKEHRTMPSSA